jgi:hypothetical protein
VGGLGAHLFGIGQQTLLVSLDARRLVASKRMTDRLVDPNLHLLFLRQGKEHFVEFEGLFKNIFADAVSG